MRALTICQPYAELIVQGKKLVENRTWETKLRERVLIHAGKSRDFLRLNEKGTVDASGIALAQMTFSAIVGYATIVDCVQATRFIPDGKGGRVPIFKASDCKRYPWLDSHEHAEGPYCYILGDVHRVKPIECRGSLSFWTYRGELPEELPVEVSQC